MTRRKICVKKDTRDRLRRLGIVGESYDAVISRLISYVEFHPEYWSKQI